VLASFDSQDGSGVEAVAFTTKRAIPGGSVASSEEEQVQIGIIAHAFPRRAASASLPPILAVPSLGR